MKKIDTKHISIYSNDSSTGSVEMDFGNHGCMFIEFDFDIWSGSWDRNGTFDDVSVKITKIERFDCDGDDVIIKPLNERNMKRIEQMILDEIHSDYERFGMDMDDFDWNDDEPTIWNTLYSGYPSRVRDL